MNALHTKVLRAADGYSLADMVNNLDVLMGKPMTPETIEMIGNDLVKEEAHEYKCNNADHVCVYCGGEVSEELCEQSKGDLWCMRCLSLD